MLSSRHLSFGTNETESLKNLIRKKTGNAKEVRVQLAVSRLFELVISSRGN